jgi:hypothetical protein
MPDTTLAASADSQPSVAPGYVPYTVLGKLEERLEHYLLRNSPYHVPKEQRERAVRLAPWCALACVPLALFSVALGVGLTALHMVLGNPMGLVSLALVIAAAVFGLRAVPGLFRRSRQGWSFFVYETLSVATLDLVDFDLLGIAAMALTLWCAFQLKYEYA